jgi:hypothetical protein
MRAFGSSTIAQGTLSKEPGRWALKIQSGKAATLLIMSFGVSFNSCFASSDDNITDQSLIGSWKTLLVKPDGTWLVTWKIEADGSYTMTDSPLNGGDAFGSSGTVNFSKGLCLIKANGKEIPTVPYYKSDASHLTIESMFGVSTWSRVVGPEQTDYFSSQFHSAQQHNNNGVGLGAQGKWQEALKEHYEACYECPTNTTFRTNLSAAHLNYGRTLVKEKKDELAREQFRQALLADPMNNDALVAMANLEGG